MKGKVKQLTVLLVVLAVLGITGCGNKAVLDEENSPQVTTAEIYSQNSGKEDSQQVKVLLYFDKDIKINEKKQDTMKITIAGQRYDKDKYQMELAEDKKKLIITIPTTAVTNGKLVIGRADEADQMEVFIDESGKYMAKEFEVEAIIPSGVILQKVKDEEGRVIKGKTQVASQFSIRSIGWLQLLDNGQIVETAVAPPSECMDQAVAVHGHEFLRDGCTEVAENIKGVINRYFGDRYLAESQEDIITVERLDDPENAEIELKFYTYLKLNGNEVKSNAEVKESSKMEVNREMTEEEKADIEKLHLNFKEDKASLYGSGNLLYQTFRLTGDAIKEEQNYSLLSLETIFRESFKNETFYDQKLTVKQQGVEDENGETHDWMGIDFGRFLELCSEEPLSDDMYVKYLCDSGEEIVPLGELIQKDSPSILAFVRDDEPLIYEEDQTILTLVCPDGKILKGLKQMIISKDENPEDPHYTYHYLREGYNKSNDISFEINVIKGDEKVKSAVITTKELEELSKENPDAVRRGYYGVSGDRTCFATMGAGGWLDYFEGLDLYWLIKNQVGEGEDGARVEFYDREQKLYTQVDDIGYLKDVSPEQYYVLDRDGTEVFGSVPMIAYGKNGYPMLAVHDHESKEYVAFNHMNRKLAEEGIVMEEGVVKNHNGPFVAGLGNREGMYGGYQKETGGDCVRMDIIYP